MSDYRPAPQLPQLPHLPPIRAVLFDLDDTLWPIVPVILRAEALLYAWLQTHAPRVAQQHTVDSLRARRMALMQAEPRYQVDLWALRQAGLIEAFTSADADLARVDEAMAVFAAARNAVTPYADVAPALQRMAQQFTLGTISNGFADLQTIQLDQHFAVSLAAHRFGCAKPDPRIFLAACAALQVDPAQAVYVGDDPLLDVDGAQKAGLRAVWMNRFDRQLPAQVQPDASCRTLFELEDWLPRPDTDPQCTR